MRTRLLSFDEMQAYLGLCDSESENGNQNDLRMAAALLRLAVKQELTGRQRECVERYYYRQQTMEEIGECLHISKSTVCRHLQRARLRLQRAVSYALLRERTGND